MIIGILTLNCPDTFRKSPACNQFYKTNFSLQVRGQARICHSRFKIIQMIFYNDNFHEIVFMRLFFIGISLKVIRNYGICDFCRLFIGLGEAFPDSFAVKDQPEKFLPIFLFADVFF